MKEEEYLFVYPNAPELSIDTPWPFRSTDLDHIAFFTPMLLHVKSN